MPLSQLQQVAASIPVGTFAVLNQNGDGSGYSASLTASGVGGIYGYASKATYDPIRHRVFYLAAGHNGGQGNPIKFIAYDVPSNQWSSLTLPSWASEFSGGNGHGYQQQGIIASKFVRARANSGSTYSADIDRDDILTIAASNPPMPATLPSYPPQSTNRGCLDGFPERNSMLDFDSRGTGQVYEWPIGAPAWSPLKVITYVDSGGVTRNLYGDGIASCYNPVHHVWLIGGGQAQQGIYSRRWWKLDALNVLTRVDDCPIDSYAAGYALFHCDPVSGKCILIVSGYQFWELDISMPAGTQWLRRQDLEAGIPNFYQYQQKAVVYSVIVPIPTADGGVLLFMGNEKTWILKYSQVSQLPQKPTNLGVTP